MAIRVTLDLMLPDYWGADDAFNAGGPDQVKELIFEDLSAFAEEAKWEITQFLTCGQTAPCEHDWKERARSLSHRLYVCDKCNAQEQRAAR